MPDFPWDRLIAPTEVAKSHPDGIIDLSIGTPVDDVPEIIQEALRAAANSPGYPLAAGCVELREAIVNWGIRTLGADSLALPNVAPTIGSKELVAWLPTILGLNANHTIAIPAVAYPTYLVGGQIVGANVVTYSSPEELPEKVDLIWVNSPSNPTGEVLSVSQLKQIVKHARKAGAVVASDECYFELGWDENPTSILHPEVCGADFTNLLAVHSLSKRSNLAGYRSGSILGDPKLIADIILLRRHAGLMVPAPIQAASIAAYGDSHHLEVQREKYRARRSILQAGLEAAGFTISHSHAGLYLWATNGQKAMDTVNWLAERGILVAPGDFYGQAGAQHVRVALTATDERVAAFADRF